MTFNSQCWQGISFAASDVFGTVGAFGAALMAPAPVGVARPVFAPDARHAHTSAIKASTKSNAFAPKVPHRPPGWV